MPLTNFANLPQQEKMPYIRGYIDGSTFDESLRLRNSFLITAELGKMMMSGNMEAAALMMEVINTESAKLAKKAAEEPAAAPAGNQHETAENQPE